MLLLRLFISLQLVAIVTGACGNCNTFPIKLSSINVISFGDIGTPALPFGADYQSVAVALGNAYFNAFSLNDKGNLSAIAFYGGKNFNLTGGTVYGSLEVAGNVYLKSFGVTKTAICGGTLNTNSGSGQFGSPPTANLGANFKPTLDLQKLKDYYTCISKELSQQSNTPGATVTPGGNMVINLVAGTRNYVTINPSFFVGIWGITVSGAVEDLIINIPGTTVQLKSWITWNLLPGMVGRVVMNLYEATTVILGGGTQGLIMAPLAAGTLTQGMVDGNVVMGSIVRDSAGSLQVNNLVRNLVNLTCQNCPCTGTDSNASPSPKASASPSPKASASPSPNVSASPSPNASASPSPKASASPSPNASASPSPNPSASPSPNASASLSPNASASPSPKASASPSPNTSASPSPSSSASPVGLDTCENTEKYYADKTWVTSKNTRCSFEYVQDMLKEYNCTAITGCTFIRCTIPVPQDLADAIRSC